MTETPAQVAPDRIANGPYGDARIERIRMQTLAAQTQLGLNRTQLAEATGVVLSTLSQWLDGKYLGRVDKFADQFERWLTTIADQAKQATALHLEPDYLETTAAREVEIALAYAQASPEMVTITLGAGMGKTRACRQFAVTRAHVTMVTMSPETAPIPRMLHEIAKALRISGPRRDISHMIGDRLKRNGRHTLLILDEAQNLRDNSVNQLRHFLDVYQVGIALVGNEEVHTRFASAQIREGQGQLHRRVGMRLHRLKAPKEDIAALIAAWRITDPEQVDLLTKIGRKPGSLGQIDKTIKLALTLANGRRQPLSAADIRSAWLNRANEVL